MCVCVCVRVPVDTGVYIQDIIIALVLYVISYNNYIYHSYHLSLSSCYSVTTGGPLTMSAIKQPLHSDLWACGDTITITGNSSTV